MVQVRKAVLLALDMASTVLTLMTGLRENPVLVLLTGRYDHILSRLHQRRINYDITRDDHVNITMLPDLVNVAHSHRFYSAPSRTRDNIGEDRSTCMNVNSMSASVLTLNYDDFFGKGARREQIYTYSISTPRCSIINFKMGWYDACVNDQFAGNASACHRYILDNFDSLEERHRLIHAGAPVDFGERGTPFLKCLGRPPQPFLYLTDLIVLQSYWAGGSYHVEVQSSRCWAKPLVRNPDWQWGLFQTEQADESAEVIFAVEPIHGVAFVVSVLYGVTSIAMILRGIYVAFSLSNLVVYIPSKVRRRFLGGFQSPSMAVTARLATGDTGKINMVLCRGENLMASDLWMNHWLYMLLSILDSLFNVRTTYIVLEMGTWMLSKKRDFGNFAFVCSAITKLTWIMCFVHTVFRYAVRVSLRMLHAVKWLHHSRILCFTLWYVDAVAMFMSYKVYAVMLCSCLLVMYAVSQTTTAMGPQALFKQPVYGGYPNLTTFWGNEIICDLCVLCTVQLVLAHVAVAVLLLTRYRRATYNRVLRLMQDRFLFVGWDAMVVMEALGIDPLNDSLVGDNLVPTTNCSLGALIQQLYASGPSGLVEFVGDSAFMNAFNDKATHNEKDPVAKEKEEERLGIVRYPLEIAQQMGLFKPVRSSSLAPIDLWRQTEQTSIKVLNNTVAVKDTTSLVTNRRGSVVQTNEPQKVGGIAERQLHIHAEWRWGRILLVDYGNAPGGLRKNEDGTLLEYVVQDAMVFLNREDLQPLLTEAPSLRIS